MEDYGKSLNYLLKTNGNENLLIFFGAMGIKKKDGKNMFEYYEYSDKFLYKTDVLLLADPSLSFYNNDSQENIETIKQITKNYKKVVACGFSAGGYGAILYGIHLKFDKVIAIAPQVVLTKSLIEHYEKELNVEIGLKTNCFFKKGDMDHHFLDLIEMYNDINIDIYHGNDPCDEIHATLIKYGEHNQFDRKNINIVSFKDMVNDKTIYSEISGFEQAFNKARINKEYMEHRFFFRFLYANGFIEYVLLNEFELKIAYLLRGISYINDYKNVRAIYSKDWRRCMDSYNWFKDKISFDVFLQTYKHEHTDKLIEDYSPKDYLLTDFDEKIHPYDSLTNAIINVIELFERYCPDKKYDVVIITRFDLIFKRQLCMLNLRRNNYFINNAIEDNFIVLKFEDLIKYKTILKKYQNKQTSPHIMITELKKSLDNYEVISKRIGKNSAWELYRLDNSVYERTRGFKK